MKTTVNIFRTLLLAVLTLTFGSCSEDSLLSELGLDGQTTTRTDGVGEVWDGSVAESFAGGSGTAENPYQIANGAQLAKLAQDVNGGKNYAGTYFVLTADILLNDIDGWENWGSTAPANPWTPIGNSSQPFTGTLDGAGHSVSGIYINSGTDYQGLVGVLGSGGALQNLGVKASYIKGSNFVGGVCGMNMMGNVINCYNSGSVAGTGGYVGGLCGENYATVTNCYNSGSLAGSEGVGGLCGMNSGTVTNCYNTGSVEGDYSVGGLCGMNSGTVTNCYNTGSVTGNYAYVGGLCGQNYATVTNCYNTGTVTGTGDYVGGVCGGNYVGGVCGGNYDGTVTNCYNTGKVTGSNDVGGVCGYNGGSITNCYNTGSVTGSDFVGGVCGENYTTVTNCYYLAGTANSGIGKDYNSGEATEKTAKQFQSGEVASLLGEGWGQTIGKDNYPVPTSDASKKVYAYTMYQGQSKETGYANNNGNVDLDLASHPNTIAVFEASGTFAGKNIVVKDGGDSYTCAELVLADGEDFYTPVAFTATKATYTRSPKVWATKNGSGSGWETICLPFSGMLYADDVAKQPVLTDLAGDYWLRSLTDFKTPNTLIFASGSTATAADHQIKAGVPYIIALPGTSFGSESLEGQTISVRGTNVAVIKTAQSVAAGSMFAFTGTFATKACNALSYRLNSENGSDGAGDLFVLDTELTDLAPFRCRIDVTGLNIGGASTRSASGLPNELRIGQ